MHSVARPIADCDPLEYSRPVPEEHSSGLCHQWSADHVGVTQGRSDTVMNDVVVIAPDLVIMLTHAPVYLSARAHQCSPFVHHCGRH
jgi:hypothetical protein